MLNTFKKMIMDIVVSLSITIFISIAFTDEELKFNKKYKLPMLQLKKGKHQVLHYKTIMVL